MEVIIDKNAKGYFLVLQGKNSFAMLVYDESIAKCLNLTLKQYYEYLQNNFSVLILKQKYSDRDELYFEFEEQILKAKEWVESLMVINVLTEIKGD